MEQHDLQSLEQQIDEILQVFDRLQKENDALREEKKQLLLERDALQEKTELARGRVEAMLERLKELETKYS